jgi:DNA-binding response OmpR family regulator
MPTSESPAPAPDSRRHILVVDDDPSVTQLIVDTLAREGYSLDSAPNGVVALEKIQHQRYDLILSDVMMPEMDGYAVLQTLHADPAFVTTPFIFLTAKGEKLDVRAGMNLGADDYLTKPFHLAELAARVNAIIRRKSFEGKNEISCNELKLDLAEKNVKVHDGPVDLTKKEYELLLYFISNKNRVISKNAIAEHLWGDSMDVADNYDFIYTHIKNLRKKLIQAGAADYIKSIYGMGYKFNV